jgi:hypothetical protein
MARRLNNFIDSFVEYGRVYNAPERYLQWAGMFLATSLVTRSVGTQMRGTILCPNLYLMMIGGPSVGKSQTCKAIRAIIQPSTDISFVPSSMTRAGMQDFMAGIIKFRRDPDNTLINSNEFVGISDELSGILPDQDIGHLTMYNELFDRPNVYNAVTRSNGEVRLENTYCSLFTGAQPQFLSLTMPEGAWGMGFMSRAIMVFDVAKARQSAFQGSTINYKLQSDLIADAKEIFKLHGWMKWTQSAINLYEEWWVTAGGLPIPQAKRLAMGYNGRREVNMLKLAMGMSLAESSDLLVDEPHVAAAIEMLLEAESHMPHIFNEMAASGSMIAIEDALDLVRNNAIAGRDTSEAALIEILMQRFPSTQIASLLTNLLNSNALKMVGNINAQGLRKFRPGDGVAKL